MLYAHMILHYVSLQERYYKNSPPFLMTRVVARQFD